MATSVFPAMYIRPEQAQQQPNILGQLGQMMAIRQQAQINPIQLQTAQLQLQQEQMNVGSQNALMQAYTQAGGDPDQTLKLAAQTGKVLPKDMLAFQQQQLAYKTGLANLTEKQLTTMQSQSAELRDAIDPIFQLPQEQQLPAANRLLAQLHAMNPQQRQLQYGLTDQQLAQLPPGGIQSIDQLKFFEATLAGHEKATEEQLKAAQTAKTTAEIPKVQAEAVTSQAEALDYQNYVQRNPGASYAQYDAWKKSLAAGQEAKARQPYELERARIEANIHAGIELVRQRDMAAANHAETELKPYFDTMHNVDALNAAIDQAQKDGNIAAARAVLGRLTGVALPGGTGRLATKEFQNLAKMGSIPEQWASKLQDIFTGDQWTDKMATDMRAFADSVGQTATVDANRRVAMTNNLYHAGIQPIPQYQRPGGGGGGGDMVSVQIPGQPPGTVRRDQLDKFKQKHPNAIISQ